MRVKREEVLFHKIKIDSKAHRHKRFEASWAYNSSAWDEETTQRYGYFGGINQAWKMTVDRKSVDLEFLMSRWSTKRHSFVTAWGEFRSSLKDVAMLTYLLMFGKAHALGFYPDVENKKRIQALKTSLSKSKYSNKATYLSWGEVL